MIFKTFF